MRINKLQLDTAIGENLTSIVFNKRNQMQGNSYYMIPLTLTFRNRQLIDGDEDQLSSYHWKKRTCGKPWSVCHVFFLDLNNGYTL